jgi:DNA segregation ATPase FtsK/SpoIIIE, S-DNA-T family
MAATRRRSRRAPARKTSAKRGSPRARPRQAREPRAPLLAPGQGKDLAGLALLVVGAFTAFTLWGAGRGAFASDGLLAALRVSVGEGSSLVPLLALAAGLALLLKVDATRVRPFRTGAVLLTAGILLALSGSSLARAHVRTEGGYAGNAMHAAIGHVAGGVGVTLATLFFLCAGLLILSGASAGAILRGAGGALRGAVEPRKAEEPVRAMRRARESAVSALGLDPSIDLEPDPVPEPEDTDGRLLEPSEPFVPEALEEPGNLKSANLRSEDLEPQPAEPVEAFPRVPSDSPPYVLPDSRVLRRGRPAPNGDADVERVSRALVAALAEHGVDAHLVGTVSGPRVTRYELQLAPGTKVSRVSSLRDDLAYALATTEIRILAPIPGKQAVGVEVPNRTANVVALGDLVDDMPQGASPLSVWLGKDIAGNVVVADLTRMPHLLIAGTTGSGKSGCINAMLSSVLLRASPDEVRMILVDPKKVELNHYETIPHLLTPVVTNMKNAAAVLGNVVREMESRYEIMGLSKARSLIELNRIRVQGGKDPLPYVLVVIDELADLMMVSPAEVEDAVIRLAQKSRAVGIHLVLATQRPSVDVITGMIKANVPSRIAFAVSSQTDSRVILDAAGAESLLGQGDMLYKPLGTSRLQRVQGAFISEEEIALLVEQCRRQAEPEFAEELLETLPDVESEELDPDEDPMLDDAIILVTQHETASVSLLQRRLRVGYTRAGRLIDMLERRGVISGYEGSKPRRVLVSPEDARRMVADPSANGEGLGLGD